MALREKVPREFTDDVRWYRYFTQKMIVAILVIGLMGLVLCKVLALIHLEMIGIFLTILALAIAMLFLCVPMPKDDLMKGAGLLASTVLVRRWILKKKGHIIYIKGYKEEKENAATGK